MTARKLALEIARVLRALDVPLRKGLAKHAGLAPDAPVLEIAARLGDATFLRGAVRMLDASAKALLRLFPYLRDPVPVTVLDQVAQALTGGADAACAQLCSSGLAVIDERQQLRPFAPLATRLAELARRTSADDVDNERIPDTHEAYLEHLAAFRIGLALAAVEHERPRATRLADLHRGDESALADALLPAFDVDLHPLDVLRLVLKQGALERADGRYRVRWSDLDDWEDPAARLMLETFWPWRHEPGPLAVLARLADDNRWHPLPDLAEQFAVAALRRAHPAGAKADVVRHVAMIRKLPGLHRREQGGVVELRMSAAGKRALGFEAPRARESARPLLIQPNLQIVVQLGARAHTVATLGRIARVVSVGKAAIFALDEAAIRRAAIEGWPASDVMTFLETHASRGVPATVERAIADWGTAPSVARVMQGTVILTPTGEPDWPAPLRPKVRTLAPGVFFIPPGEHDEALRALKKSGFAHRPEGASDSTEALLQKNPWRHRASFVLADARKQRDWLAGEE